METCEAVQAAMGAFWESGYKGTSLTDLESATGLTKGSLYKAFDDKHDIFLQSLAMYLENGRKTLFSEFDKPGTAIDKLMYGVATFGAGCSSRGCLGVKAAGELAAEDSEVREVLVEHWGKIEGKLLGILEQGQREGSVRTDIPIETAANLIIRMAMGTSVAGPLSNPAENTIGFAAAVNLLKA